MAPLSNSCVHLGVISYVKYPFMVTTQGQGDCQSEHREKFQTSDLDLKLQVLSIWPWAVDTDLLDVVVAQRGTWKSATSRSSRHSTPQPVLTSDRGLPLF